MHARHRSPGNGYRGMGGGGVAAASRVSPEGSVRVHGGMYGPDYRGNYNRGFGRGQPKPFHIPQPPPRRGDVLMEAGRLAAEYLVTKGLLPPNALSGKWQQNGSLKNQVRDFIGFRSKEEDGFPISPEGRPSALDRLGDHAPNTAVSGRRRFPDEFSPMGSRNLIRGRKRMGSFKDYGSEWNRELGRSGSWSERNGPSSDKEGDDDAFSELQEDRQVGKDDDASVEQKSIPSESAAKSDTAGNLETALGKYQLSDDVNSQISSSSTGKDLSAEANMEPIERSDAVNISNVSMEEEVKDESNKNEVEKPSGTEGIFIEQCTGEVDSPNKNGNDLLKLCNFAKVPTKTRSSLTIKGSKVDPVLISEDENTHKSGLTTKSVAPVENVSVDVSSNGVPTSQSPNSNFLESDISKVPAEGDAGELGLACTVSKAKCTRSTSFPERSLAIEQESSEDGPTIARCSSMVIDRGEKRLVPYGDCREGFKKPREWNPSIDVQADNYMHEKQQNSQVGGTSPGEDAVLTSDQRRLTDISLFTENGSIPCSDYTEEKQLFPSSFKICDLNLMEALDVNENRNANKIHSFPSLQQCKTEAAPVDVDLSMSSNCSISDNYGKHGADGKEVEVIDLEIDAIQEDKTVDNLEQKDEAVFTDLESFPSHSQHVNNIPDGQDGYGLMISELLGTDIPNCSSVQPEINSLDNDMDLHNGEGILGDDDSIYMSLGEIPISMPEI